MADILGVDVGGVIIDRVNDGTDTAFHSDNFLNTTAVSGAFEALRELVDKRFEKRVYIVSKCGKVIQRKTLLWMKHHSFHERTGIPPEHVHFCLERRDKADICETLGITHFVDDRLEVLSYLTTVDTRYLFQPRENEVLRFLMFLPKVHRVNSWEEILKRELRS